MESEELVLITRGRKTGREHRVRVWYAREGDLLWLRADERHPPDSEEVGWIRRRTGRRPDWYLNLHADPRCRVVLDGQEQDAVFEAPPDPLSPPASDLRRLVELWREKYGAEWVQDWYVEKGRVPVKVRLVPPDEQGREQAYLDGYRRVPDGADADFAAIERAGMEDMRLRDLP